MASKKKEIFILIISPNKEICFAAYSSFPTQYFHLVSIIRIFRRTADRKYYSFSHKPKF